MTVGQVHLQNLSSNFGLYGVSIWRRFHIECEQKVGLKMKNCRGKSLLSHRPVNNSYKNTIEELGVVMVYFLLGVIILLNFAIAKVFWFLPLDIVSTLHLPSWLPLFIAVLFVAWCFGEGNT